MAEHDDATLRRWERWALGLVGVLALVAAGLLLEFPPDHAVVAPANSKTETVQTSADTGTPAVALLGVGALFLLVGLNGRRLSKVTLPGGVGASAIGSASAAAETALRPKVQEISAAEDVNGTPFPEVPSTTIRLDGTVLGVYALDETPTWVVQALLQQPGLPDRLAIEFVARKVGRGNNPYLVRFRGEDQIWKISKGGRGKSGPTVDTLG